MKRAKVKHLGHTIEVTGDLCLLINEQVHDRVKIPFGIPFISKNTLRGKLPNGSEVVATAWQTIGEVVEIYVDGRRLYRGHLL